MTVKASRDHQQADMPLSNLLASDCIVDSATGLLTLTKPFCHIRFWRYAHTFAGCSISVLSCVAYLKAHLLAYWDCLPKCQTLTLRRSRITCISDSYVEAWLEAHLAALSVCSARQELPGQICKTNLLYGMKPIRFWSMLITTKRTNRLHHESAPDLFLLKAEGLLIAAVVAAIQSCLYRQMLLTSRLAA